MVWLLSESKAKERRKLVSQLRHGQADTVNSSLLTYCSFQFVSELVETYPHQGGQSALLSRPTHISISSRKTCTDRLRVTSSQISGYSVVLSNGPIKPPITVVLSSPVSVMDHCLSKNKILTNSNQ